jgi:hypothetical protein
MSSDGSLNVKPSRLEHDPAVRAGAKPGTAEFIG